MMGASTNLSSHCTWNQWVASVFGGGLGVPGMVESVLRHFQAGIVASTRNSYNSGMKRFYTFCKKFEIFTPFPVYEQLLCRFVAYLADEGLSPQTAMSYFSRRL